MILQMHIYHCPELGQLPHATGTVTQPQQDPILELALATGTAPAQLFPHPGALARGTDPRPPSVSDGLNWLEP